METLPPVEIPPLTELITSLEKATLMAKQLPSTIQQTQIFQIYSSLQNAQNQLTSFLSNFNTSQTQPQPLQQPQLENSVSSAIGGGGDADDEVEPMLIGDDRNEEENSEFIIEKVEERMKNCAIHSNKRRKRNDLSSPSSIQELDQRVYYNDICNSNNNGVVLVQGFAEEFDPQATRLRSLELIYQFHG